MNYAERTSEIIVAFEEQAKKMGRQVLRCYLEVLQR
jgi:hypothetical protein